MQSYTALAVLTSLQLPQFPSELDIPRLSMAGSWELSAPSHGNHPIAGTVKVCSGIISIHQFNLKSVLWSKSTDTWSRFWSHSACCPVNRSAFASSKYNSRIWLGGFCFSSAKRCQGKIPWIPHSSMSKKILNNCLIELLKELVRNLTLVCFPFQQMSAHTIMFLVHFSTFVLILCLHSYF